MTQRQDEAIVLRTWSFQEADLLVSFFTRRQGRVKGVARHAMRSRRRFGGALEPMTHVRATWAEKPKQELVRLDSFEILWSPLRDPVDYARSAALSLVAEILESALPEHAPEDDIFRLTLATLNYIRAGEVWMPITYFLLWTTRLMGWMPEITQCCVCSESLRGGAIFYSPMRDGLTCVIHRGNGSVSISADSAALAQRIFSKPIGEFEQFPRERGADLRRFTVSTLERHLDDKLLSARALARI
ncbi:MAG: DNA repair protein RecO [Acidobacteria bacterium]|nr:DNA repair protein RecO [Acidobacteriota bacterium]